jgi:hypothetical protein
MSTTIEDNFRFDSRLRERMLAKGRVTAEEIEQRLSALPDLDAEAEALGVDAPSGTPRPVRDGGAER